MVIKVDKMDKAEQDRLYNKFCYVKENMPDVIGNESLQCKDCKYCHLENAIECDMYPTKPYYVLDAIKNCKKYEKKIIKNQVDFDLEELLPGFDKRQ